MQIRTLRPLLLAGGACGALVRWMVGRGLDGTASNFPWGTFAVNLAGCALLGYALTTPPSDRRSALTVGFCGGLTTFSTLMVEVVRKSEAGQVSTGGGYLLFSIALGVGVFLAGRSLGLSRASLDGVA